MAKRRGIVTRIGKSQYSHYIQLDDDGFYFNTKYNPKCGKGDEVGIEFEKKNDQRGQIKNVKILTDNGGPKGFQDSGGGTSGGGGKRGGGGGFDAGRQDSIVYQSSRKDALVLADILISNKLVKVPAGDKGRIVVESLVDELVCRFFADASDPRKAIKSEEEVKEDEGDDWGDAEEESGGDEDTFDDDWE